MWLTGALDFKTLRSIAYGLKPFTPPEIKACGLDNSSSRITSTFWFSWYVTQTLVSKNNMEYIK